jgi:hypothetical protein
MALLCETNCEDGGATLLDKQSLLRKHDTSSPNPSTGCGKETSDVKLLTLQIK